MLVEPGSLCWLTGRLVDARDGKTWALEFARYSAPLMPFPTVRFRSALILCMHAASPAWHTAPNVIFWDQDQGIHIKGCI